MADLGDRGAVQGVVESAVASPRQPMDDPCAGGELDRGGTGVRDVAVGGGEPQWVAGVADEHRRDDRADPEISVSVVADAVTAAVMRALES